MAIDGGCYCGKIRYRAKGEPAMRGQCHCRECQYITGGGPNFFAMMPTDGFEYTSGQPAQFTRDDIENAVTREFCPNCGTHLATQINALPMLVLKVGTMDDPSQYGAPDMAIFTCDKQAFHQIPGGIPQFEKMSGG